jgi:hypothetical protein
MIDKVKRSPIFLFLVVFIFILIVSVATKLSTPLILKNLITSKAQKFISETYETDLNVSIESVNVKIIKLFLLKPTLIVKGLRIGNKAIFETIEAEIDLKKYRSEQTLYFKYLKAKLAEIIISNKFNINGNMTKIIDENNSKIQRIFFKEAKFEKFDLIIVSEELEKEKFEFRAISLSFNDFAIPDNSNTNKTNFKLSSELKNYHKNGHLNLEGEITPSKETKGMEYKATGSIVNLDLQNLLTTVTGNKQAVSGRLNAHDIQYHKKSSGENNLTAEIKLDKGASFLKSYIVNAQAKPDQAIELERILEQSEALGINVPDDQYYREFKAGPSGFTEFSSILRIVENNVYLSNIQIKNAYVPSIKKDKKIEKKKKSLFSRFKNLF